MFIDRAIITIKAGDGGNGMTSFVHFKGKVSGGPDGGDGGKGGNVVFTADKGMNSLLDYYYKTKYVAENGENGGAKQCFGKYGNDLVLKVPLGTVIKDKQTGNIIADMFYPLRRGCMRNCSSPVHSTGYTPTPNRSTGRPHRANPAHCTGLPSQQRCPIPIRCCYPWLSA